MWKETYESAPLEREAILALSNVNGSIRVKFPEIELSPLKREAIIASSNAHGSIPAKFPLCKTQPPILHVAPVGASDTESPANDMRLNELRDTVDEQNCLGVSHFDGDRGPDLGALAEAG